MAYMSVLMTARNSESTIRRAVISTLAAMPPDSELVVLNDGSSDGTGEVLQRITDRRLTMLSSSHIGVAAGLNYLFASTDSHVVARMDADDICLPGRLNRELRALRNGRDVVFTTVVEFGTVPLKVSPTAMRGIHDRAFPFHLLLTNPVAHPTMMARRSVIAAVGGYRLLPTEDYDLWLRLAFEGARMVRLGVPGLAYRKHAAQITASSSWRRASWANTEISEAFGRLSTQLLGSKFLRLSTLSSCADLTVKESDAILADFSHRFELAVRDLPRIERKRLAQKCSARIEWVKSARMAHPRASAL